MEENAKLFKIISQWFWAEENVLLIWAQVTLGLVVIVPAIVPKVHGHKHGREWWIFKGDKNP
jgi:hypothetical protein